MKEEVKGGGGAPNRELYALLNVSPEASDEEIRKAYRQWAQVYHPDKYQAAQVLHHPNFFPFLGCVTWDIVFQLRISINHFLNRLFLLNINLLKL